MFPLKKFLSFGLWCIVTCPQLVAQEGIERDSIVTGTIELGGFAKYNYRRASYPNYFFGSYEKREKVHTISVEPFVGYLVSPEFQTICEINYSFILSTLNNYAIYTRLDGSDEVEEYEFSQYQHLVGVSGGVLWVGEIAASIWLFVGPKIGVFWIAARNNLYQRVTNWSKPALLLPEVVGGIKFFPLVPNWALNVQMVYQHIRNPNINSPVSTDAIGVEFGISIFL